MLARLVQLTELTDQLCESHICIATHVHIHSSGSDITKMTATLSECFIKVFKQHSVQVCIT